MTRNKIVLLEPIRHLAPMTQAVYGSKGLPVVTATGHNARHFAMHSLNSLRLGKATLITFQAGVLASHRVHDWTSDAYRYLTLHSSLKLRTTVMMVSPTNPTLISVRYYKLPHVCVLSLV